MKHCTVSGCERTYFGLGMCRKCYMRSYHTKRGKAAMEAFK